MLSKKSYYYLNKSSCIKSKMRAIQLPFLNQTNFFKETYKFKSFYKFNINI